MWSVGQGAFIFLCVKIIGWLYQCLHWARDNNKSLRLSWWSCLRFTFSVRAGVRQGKQSWDCEIGHISQRCVSQVSCAGRGAGVCVWLDFTREQKPERAACASARAARFLLCGWGWAGLERLDSEAGSGKGRLYWDEPIGLAAVREWGWDWMDKQQASSRESAE